MSDEEERQMHPGVVQSFQQEDAHLYANLFNAAVSPYDVRLSFGRVNPVTGDKYDVVIYLSHQIAAELVDVLGGVLSDFKRSQSQGA